MGKSQSRVMGVKKHVDVKRCVIYFVKFVALLNSEIDPKKCEAHEFMDPSR